MNDSGGVRFYGRRPELTALSRVLEEVRRDGRGRILAVRGRRQVGKSTVVERFVDQSGMPYVYVTGVHRSPLAQQLADATDAIGESQRPLPDAPILTESKPRRWREWFARLGIAARSGPVIAVLDEFPWLTAVDPSLEGELQAIWDRTLERLPILLVLVGSDVTMMDKLAHHDRPLFGRLTPMVIPPLDPGAIGEALPNTAPVEVVDACLITGGYPRLVRDLAARSDGDPVAYVVDSLADPYSPLVTSARLSLDAEFPEPRSAYQALSAIGAAETGRLGYTDILSTISDPAERNRAETSVSRALRTLIDVKGLIEIERPAWASPSSKLRRYRVADPYLRFWFRFVERSVDVIARGRADIAIDAFRANWPTWRGHVVEPFVRRALEQLAPAHPALADVREVHPWWVRDGRVEVDVVAMTESHSAIVGTIKWRSKGVSARDIEQLRRHRDLVPRAGEALLAAISPLGGAVPGADIRFGAADLLDAWG